MVETHDHFEKRLSALGRKHEKMTHGYTTRVTRDGLIVVEPKKARVVRNGSLLKILTIAVVGFIGFKAFALAAVGPQTYEDRLVKLSEGTVLEQAGAFAMGIDPVTELLAEQIGPLLK